MTMNKSSLLSSLCSHFLLCPSETWHPICNLLPHCPSSRPLSGFPLISALSSVLRFYLLYCSFCSWLLGVNAFALFFLYSRSKTSVPIRLADAQMDLSWSKWFYSFQRYLLVHTQIPFRALSTFSEFLKGFNFKL